MKKLTKLSFYFIFEKEDLYILYISLFILYVNCYRELMSINL